jgi:FkbM family methyltransferase
MLVGDVSVRDELEALLAESVGDATIRERTAFDVASAGRSGIVLFGAGGLGRQVARGLKRVGVEPLAFADNNPRAQHTRIEGIEVLPPSEAAARHAEKATFVVTIWGANSPHRYAHTRAQLQSLGATAVSSFPPLLWKYSEVMLPHYCQDLPHRALEQAPDIRRGLALWADAASRQEYLTQVRFRLRADFDGLAQPVAHPQYFPDDLFRYGPDETFIDCGAYDGDTIKVLLERHRATVGRIVALEPDPVNVATLEAYVATLQLPRGIEILPLAAAAERGRAFIETTGTASSALTASATAGAAAIDCAPLDELLAAESPTFIKMDIEGAEPEALEGARRTIARTRPVLAICVYHRQDHLWRIPLALRAMCEDYQLFLRPHNEEGWDLICYAVPTERLRTATESRTNA